MPIFSMFLFIALLFVAFVLLVGWLVSLVFFVRGRKKGSRSQMWFAGVPLGLISGLGIWLLYVIFAPSNPAIAYQHAFGIALSRDITELRSSEDGFGDEEMTYLTFKASPETIKQLTAKGWDKPIAKIWSEEDKTDFRKEDMPNWWRPEEINGLQFFSAENRRKKFDTEYENLYYDLDAHQTYYYGRGFDRER